MVKNSSSGKAPCTTPVSIFCVLAAVVVVVYIIYNIKTGLHMRDIMDSELKQNRKQHLLHVLNYFDVSVVYGIMELLIKLIIVGTVIYTLCVQRKTGVAYTITGLILIVWITGLIHFIHVYNNVNEGGQHNVAGVRENMYASIDESK